MGIHASQPPAPEFSSLDLSYALEVNRIANSMMSNALIDEFGDVDTADPTRVAAWREKNPFDDFVTRVIDATYSTARFIRRYQAEKAQQG
nr:hypothetical protein [uncultured Pseudomonas sp.]